MKLITHSKPASKHTKKVLNKKKKAPAKAKRATTTIPTRTMALRRPKHAEKLRDAENEQDLKESIGEVLFSQLVKQGVDKHFKLEPDGTIIQHLGMTSEHAVAIKRVMINALDSPAVQRNLKSVLEFDQASPLEKWTIYEDYLNSVARDAMHLRMDKGLLKFNTPEDEETAIHSFSTLFQLFLVDALGAAIHRKPDQGIPEADVQIFQVYDEYWNKMMNTLFSIPPDVVQASNIRPHVAEDIYKRYFQAVKAPDFVYQVETKLASLVPPGDLATKDENGKMVPTEQLSTYLRARQFTVLKEFSVPLEAILADHGFKTLADFFLAQRGLQLHYLNHQVLTYKSMVETQLSSFLVFDEKFREAYKLRNPDAPELPPFDVEDIRFSDSEDGSEEEYTTEAEEETGEKAEEEKTETNQQEQQESKQEQK